MTKEEAILILEEEAEFLYQDDRPYNREAFDMAISALSVKPISVRNDGTLFINVLDAEKVNSVVVTDYGFFYKKFCEESKQDDDSDYDSLVPDEYKTEPKLVRCGECVRHDNCWIYDEHKDDNGTCVWAERNNITDEPNDEIETENDVIEPSDLISREKAIESMELESAKEGAYGYIDIKSAVEMLEELPSAETTGALDDAIAKYVADGYMLPPPASRQSGEWEFVDHEYFAGEYFCSNCGKRAEVNLYGEWILSNYCPSCGAYMVHKESEK